MASPPQPSLSLSLKLQQSFLTVLSPKFSPGHTLVFHRFKRFSPGLSTGFSGFSTEKGREMGDSGKFWGKLHRLRL